ncbi:MAG TPA: type II secretion system F family protein, partial [Solirubrobacteraceae bacterium]|nr:type II secretion system F family protein [Solirubrobacteraceae bacterium]
PLALGVADLMAVKAAATLAGVPVGLALGASAPGRLGVLVVIAAPLAGFLAPDVWLARRARHRGAAMARELADVLDLLRVSVEAGLAVPRALQEVGRRRGGTLGSELTRAARRNALGVPRAQVLEELTARCPVPAVGDLATAIIRAERHGAPLACALSALALEARAESGRRVHDAAARAGPKIQLVVATVLVPAVMLILAAALAQAFLPAL